MFCRIIFFSRLKSKLCTLVYVGENWFRKSSARNRVNFYLARVHFLKALVWWTHHVDFALAIFANRDVFCESFLSELNVFRNYLLVIQTDSPFVKMAKFSLLSVVRILQSYHLAKRIDVWVKNYLELRVLPSQISIDLKVFWFIFGHESIDRETRELFIFKIDERAERVAGKEAHNLRVQWIARFWIVIHP